MRYAIKTDPQETQWEDLLAVWQAADSAQVFESAWNFDHFYPINVADTRGPCFEAWTMLAALAQATSRIRIGCMVSGVVYRHPAVLANMVATLDIISGGRLELGLGAAWNQEECDAYGIELGTLTERFDRFDEACAVIHSLLTQEVSNFAGKYYQLKDARCNPPPLQKPHPRWCIGGNGERRTFPNVVRYADHWNYAGFDVEGFVAKRDALFQQCRDAGRDPATLMTSVHLPLTDDTSAMRDQAQRFKEAGLDLLVFYLHAPHGPDQVLVAEEIASRAG